MLFKKQSPDNPHIEKKREMETETESVQILSKRELKKKRKDDEEAAERYTKNKAAAIVHSHIAKAKAPLLKMSYSDFIAMEERMERERKETVFSVHEKVRVDDSPGDKLEKVIDTYDPEGLIVGKDVWDPQSSGIKLLFVAKIHEKIMDPLNGETIDHVDYNPYYAREFSKCMPSNEEIDNKIDQIKRSILNINREIVSTREMIANLSGPMKSALDAWLEKCGIKEETL